jgi:hypothetical protein
MGTDEKIKPAMTAAEWARGINGHDWEHLAALAGTEAQLIALANAALPDSDPRKITRERVQSLRALAEELAFDDCTIPEDEDAPLTLAGREHRHRLIAEARNLAAALESYLPPE